MRVIVIRLRLECDMGIFRDNFSGYISLFFGLCGIEIFGFTFCLVRR